MPRPNAISTHPDRSRLEFDLISGRNVLEISQESGISPATLYAARVRLIAERDARNEADADASRLGAARRLAVLAQDVRRARHDAVSAGNGRLAKDLAEVERKIISDISSLSPEVELDDEAKDAHALAEALFVLLENFPTRQNFQVVLDHLRANGARKKITEAVATAARTLTKAEAV